VVPSKAACVACAQVAQGIVVPVAIKDVRAIVLRVADREKGGSSARDRHAWSQGMAFGEQLGGLLVGSNRRTTCSV